MDSCFPPLAALSLRDKKSSGSNNQKGGHRHSAGTISGPLKAPGKLDILQDLDLYYIRQIAHNLKEYDLEQKIEIEIRMREGTTRLLRACHNHSNHNSGSVNAGQSLEASKNLLASEARVRVYTAELQARKGNNKPRDTQADPKPLARLSISDLRLPLMWRDSDHFKNRGDPRRFAVFCLVRVGTDVQETALLQPIDRTQTDLTFPDTLIFSEVPADFSCRLEVYSHELQSDGSLAWAPRCIKRTLHGSISKNVGKKLALALKEESNHAKMGLQFELVGTATLGLQDVDDYVRTHDLLRFDNISAPNTKSGLPSNLPLFGHFCARVALLPDCRDQAQFHGEIQHPKATWAVLQNFCLHLFGSQDQCLNGQEPIISVLVDQISTIQINPSNTKEIQIINLQNRIEEVESFSLRSQDECRNWLKALKQHSKQQEIWGPAGQGSPMYIPNTNNKNQFKNVTGIRQCSLYDETPIPVSDNPRGRPSIHEVFNLASSQSLNSCGLSGDNATDLQSSIRYNSLKSTCSSHSSSTNASTKSISSQHPLIDISSNHATSGTKTKSKLRPHWLFSSKNSIS